MSTISKERVKDILEFGAGRIISPITDDEIMELARIALASLEAEAVYQVVYDSDTWRDINQTQFADHVNHGSPVRIVYAAPPAPVVPDEKPMPKASNMFAIDAVAAIAETRGWNACRAAMLQGSQPVSNRDELPLDYLQGHKDGLEWAAQMAEANHPQTGDWLYDDPVELAKAIRKGPDMPELKSVPADADDNFYSWFGRFWSENYQQNNYTTSAKQMLGTMAEFAFRAGRESATQVGNSPVIPDGWVLVPKEPTEDMIVNGFESEPDESFSDEKEWEAYDAMSGCQQAAHRAKLCWAAMIAAAPKPEVK